jgi:polyferredoxin
VSLLSRVTQSTLWRTVVAVLWSFIGLRKNSEFEKDVLRITPLHILVVGVVAAFIFVIALIVLVNVVVAK